MAFISRPRLSQGSDARLQEISDIINHLPEHLGPFCTADLDLDLKTLETEYYIISLVQYYTFHERV